jgi:hypothetical protein
MEAIRDQKLLTDIRNWQNHERHSEVYGGKGGGRFTRK